MYTNTTTKMQKKVRKKQHALAAKTLVVGRFGVCMIFFFFFCIEAGFFTFNMQYTHFFQFCPLLLKLQLRTVAEALLQRFLLFLLCGSFLLFWVLLFPSTLLMITPQVFVVCVYGKSLQHCALPEIWSMTHRHCYSLTCFDTYFYTDDVANATLFLLFSADKFFCSWCRLCDWQNFNICNTLLRIS